MDIESISSNDSLTTIENDLTSDVLAKLRRLKIQESILTASLNKSKFDLTENILNSSVCSDWKVYSAKIRNSVTEIKTIFEDIKVATSDSHDNLKNIDIDEVKKDVLILDGKIKSLEDFISSELLSLKRNEEEIMTQMNEEPKVNRNIKSKVKIQSKQYNEVVPSPIRVLINSPLKCAEVQRLQEFMSKSKNNYGGWNEYNHNSFILIWNKFYANDEIEILEKNMEQINNNNLLPKFTNEVHEKIPGVKLSEILSHSKWYSEFCYLKMCQQKALDKWRDNKRKIKKRQNVNRNTRNSENSKTEKQCRKQNNIVKYQKRSNHCHLEEQEFIQSQSSLGNIASENFSSNEIPSTALEAPNTSFSGSVEHIKAKLKLSTFARPTKQWINRCHGSHEFSPHIHNNIETVDKLSVPNWRMCLN